MSSCGFSVSKNISEARTSNPYLNGSFEPLKRSEYTLLNNTIGEAKAHQFYVLFFPIGKARTNQELESNAYNQAVANCKSADAVLMPRSDYRRFCIPLILFNYTSQKVTVTGRGVKINDDAMTVAAAQ